MTHANTPEARRNIISLLAALPLSAAVLSLVYASVGLIG